jgi:hypothetical protein
MKLLLIFVLNLLLVSQTLAHSGGFTYEQSTGEYFVDIGSTKKEFKPNELSLFEFNLYPVNDPNNLADFDHVYVTVSDAEHGVVYSGSIYRPEGSLTVMSYSFPSGGEYKMSARFGKGTESLTEVTFPISVKVNPETKTNNPSSSKQLQIAALGMIALAGVLMVVRRRKA